MATLSPFIYSKLLLLSLCHGMQKISWCCMNILLSIFFLCSMKEIKSYNFRTKWRSINPDSIFTFGFLFLLKFQNINQSENISVMDDWINVTCISIINPQSRNLCFFPPPDLDSFFLFWFLIHLNTSPACWICPLRFLSLFFFSSSSSTSSPAWQNPLMQHAWVNPLALNETCPHTLARL